MHSIKSKPIQSCITLRQFLKISGLKIRTGAIPFKNQTGRTTDMTEFEKDIKIASSPLNENTIKAIEDKIAVLENRISCYELLENCSFSSKVFLLSYMLFNSTHFYISSDHKNIIKSNDVAASDFPEQVEKFLKVSCDTTHFLENYVESCEDNAKETKDDYEKICGQIMKHEENVNQYAKKLKGFIEKSTDKPQMKLFTARLLNLKTNPCVIGEQNKYEVQLDTKSCLSDGLLEEKQMSPIGQLDGNDDVFEFHGLAGISSEGVVIPFLINFFRGLEQHWNAFDKHILCKRATNKSGSRCLFCHLRSVTL